MDTIKILHLSDLHIKQGNNFDISTVLDELLKRIKKDKENGIKPEFIAVTGDIAFSGKKKEYEIAAIFFDELIKITNISKKNLFIVPGNHDVDLDLYEKESPFIYPSMKKLDSALEKDRKKLFRGFKSYYDFIQTNQYGEYEYINKKIHFIATRKLESGKKVTFLGLNSAWMTRKKNKNSKNEKQMLALGSYQINKAYEEYDVLDKADHSYLTIHLFHHPLSLLWYHDTEIYRYKSKSQNKKIAIMAGHAHDISNKQVKDDFGTYYDFQTGASYLKSDSKWPARFQYIQFDFKKDEIKLDYRKFNKKYNRWNSDSDMGDDGKWIIKNAGLNGDINKDNHNSPLSLTFTNIPEIYIPLLYYYQDESYKIEDVIGDHSILLITGCSGSGKTTLLKHFNDKKNPENSKNDSEEELMSFPIFRSLSDLKEKIIGEKDVQKIFDDSLQKSDSKKIRDVIFLLDGLNEIKTSKREMVIKSFKDFQIKKNKEKKQTYIKLVISSRPNVINNELIKLLNDNHIKIESFNKNQIKKFIKKWFELFYFDQKDLGKKLADKLYEKINSHDNISGFIETPLLLEAICFLYNTKKEFPFGKADLYKRIFQYISQKEFQSSESIQYFFEKFAWSVHKKENIETNNDKEIYKKIYREISPFISDETKELLNIDKITKLGILKFQNGSAKFWHSLLQDFFVARYLIRTKTDYKKAIKDLWDNENNHDIIKMYIEILSLNNTQWALDIIDNIIKDKSSNIKNKILASSIFIDISKSKRNKKLNEEIIEFLTKIIKKPNINPNLLVNAGEILGWLKYEEKNKFLKGLNEFITVKNGEYNFEKSQDIITIKKFKISKYPVTNACYKEFIESKGYKDKDFSFWTENGEKWMEKRKEKISKPKYWQEKKWKCPNSPVIGISWYEAVAFCRWLSLRKNDEYTYALPTEEQWKAAAAGKENRTFPWGESIDKYKCNYFKSGIGKTSPVDIFHMGATPEKIYDMSGNIYEWTRTLYNPDNNKVNNKNKDKEDFSEIDENVILVGCSFLEEEEECQCMITHEALPNRRSLDLGFRVVATLKE